jgi:hypothetical protein
LTGNARINELPLGCAWQADAIYTMWWYVRSRPRHVAVNEF